jgi:hypothetical protein
MKPIIPITDARFVYTPAHATDIRVRFNRVRRELQQTATETRSHLALFEHRRKEKR